MESQTKPLKTAIPSSLLSSKVNPINPSGILSHQCSFSLSVPLSGSSCVCMPVCPVAPHKSKTFTWLTSWLKTKTKTLLLFYSRLFNDTHTVWSKRKRRHEGHTLESSVGFPQGYGMSRFGEGAQGGLNYLFL